MHTYIRTYIHTYRYTYIRTYIHTYILACVDAVKVPQVVKKRIIVSVPGNLNRYSFV